MKKGEVWAIFLLAVAVLVVTYVYQPVEEVSLAPSDYFPHVPTDCSDSQIRITWSGVYQSSAVSNDGLTIVGGTVEEGACSDYVAFKNTSDELFILYGSKVRGWPNEEYVGEFLNRTVYLNVIEVNAEHVAYNVSSFDFDAFIEELEVAADSDEFFASFEDYNYEFFENRTILVNSGARSAHNDVFDYVSSLGEWVNSTDPINKFSFEESESLDEEGVYESDGVVYGNYTYDALFSTWEYADFVVCESDWVAHTSECNSTTEMKTTYYIDDSNCYDADPPENETVGCDADGNGVIGDENDIDDTHFDVEVEIDGDEYDEDEDYDGEQDVELIDDDANIARVEFEWDFDDGPLDLREIEIEIQDEDEDFGYIIVKGIDAEKTVRVDKVADSDMICVKDKDSLDDIDDIDDDCDGSSEYYIECPGEDDDEKFECALSSQDVYVVRNLDHSGVRELEGASQTNTNNNNDNNNGNSNTCTPYWSCGSWGSCVSGQKTRTCTDLNNCEAAKTETDTCVVGCNTDWDCTLWSPSDSSCEDGETQTRTCTDLNGCGTTSDRPSQSKTCEQDSSDGFSKQTIMIGIIAIAAVLIIAVLIVIFKVLKNKKKAENVQTTPPQMRLSQRQPRGFYNNNHYGR